ncbi:MAG: ribosomal-processing cysteine protease Prp [Clostridia bacterium]|nr:ribosomal-processing cysteine protease Prp [Clostridia bacterium]
MTKITFYKTDDLIVGFEVCGHTGKDDFGKDLLCCQISTVAQVAVVGVQEVLKLNAFCEISDGYLKVKVQKNDAPKVQILFETCLQSFKSIIIDEKKYAKLEVKNV